MGKPRKTRHESRPRVRSCGAAMVPAIPSQSVPRAGTELVPNPAPPVHPYGRSPWVPGNPLGGTLTPRYVIRNPGRNLRFVIPSGTEGTAVRVTDSSLRSEMTRGYPSAGIRIATQPAPDYPSALGRIPTPRDRPGYLPWPVGRPSSPCAAAASGELPAARGLPPTSPEPRATTPVGITTLASPVMSDRCAVRGDAALPCYNPHLERARGARAGEGAETTVWRH
jgi:hypothetical protein